MSAADTAVEPSTSAWTPEQPQMDRNGVLITEGCTLRRSASGGILPGYVAEGIASYLPGDRNDGRLYIKQVERGHARYIYALNRDELEVLA